MNDKDKWSNKQKKTSECDIYYNIETMSICCLATDIKFSCKTEFV